MSVLILPPAAESLNDLPPGENAPLPLDTILVVEQGDIVLQSLSVALAAVSVSPWVPLVLVTPRPASGLLRFAVGGASLHAITLQLQDGEVLQASVLRAAVRGRGRPTARELEEFIARGGGAAVVPLLAMALAGTPLKRSEHVKLLAVTGLGADAWGKLHRCLGCIADYWRDPRAVEALADAHKISPKTVWGRCQRFFGLTWREACGWSAWEALVEKARWGAANGLNAG